MEDLITPDKQRKPGRPPKADSAKKCVMVRFTDEEYARFLTMFETFNGSFHQEADL
ncbi:plasmid mobilization protein [Alistipes sp. An116]|uniref:plasmid mobilization protein n=1 Tax=Alistipes sp. An116 TaxID=1965546 RepID=UPI0013A617CA|nr:hypothetical protein [Alistipes sp. An116]